MTERYVSVALLFPTLALAIGAWLMWTLHDSSPAINPFKPKCDENSGLM
jgi:hypothetical protein